MDFSVVLSVISADGTEYRLLRYDGKQPSDHLNDLEAAQKLPNGRFRNAFHIHRATERYQRAGLEIDKFADVTNKYNSLQSALIAFIDDAGFVVTDSSPEQPRLF